MIEPVPRPCLTCGQLCLPSAGEGGPGRCRWCWWLSLHGGLWVNYRKVLDQEEQNG